MSKAVNVLSRFDETPRQCLLLDCDGQKELVFRKQLKELAEAFDVHFLFVFRTRSVSWLVFSPELFSVQELKKIVESDWVDPNYRAMLDNPKLSKCLRARVTSKGGTPAPELAFIAINPGVKKKRAVASGMLAFVHLHANNAEQSNAKKKDAKKKVDVERLYEGHEQVLTGLKTESYETMKGVD